VEETEEDTERKEKGSSEEFNVEDCQKKDTINLGCQLIRPLTDTHTVGKSDPGEDLRMFDIEDEGARIQIDNGNRNVEHCVDMSVKKKDQATFLVDEQYLSGDDTLGDKTKQICTIDNGDVIGHLCCDKNRHCRMVDESVASVQNCENIRMNGLEVASYNKCKIHNMMLRNSEWQKSFNGNELTAVNCGDGGVDSVLRQGRHERLYLKWNLKQQVSSRDWISLCSMSEYCYSMQHKTSIM
jgi:hypothetical protein